MNREESWGKIIARGAKRRAPSLARGLCLALEGRPPHPSPLSQALHLGSSVVLCPLPVALPSYSNTV